MWKHWITSPHFAPKDLPNNMIHQVPIFSLPQEWLYCETWCHKSELAKAKSIDLCNNPLTKESKLDAARRIVSEWTDYDEEMHRFAEEIKSGNPAASKQQGGEKEQQHQHSELWSTKLENYKLRD